MEGILLVIGNPLLDISANVPMELLNKYDLKPGNQILAESKHIPLYQELKDNYKVEYIAGGAAQNTARATQWMLQIPKACVYVGCVGDDHFGRTLKDAAESAGVSTYYLVDPKVPTGTCACLITDKERSLVAYLGAAEAYKQDHFFSKEIQDLLNKAKYFYCTGFFLTHSPQVLVAMGQQAAKHNKCFLMNLSAPFLLEFFWEQMSSVLPFTDVVFGNELEAIALGKKLDCGDDLEVIARKLSEFPKENKARRRIVIFTQGGNQTIVCLNGEISRFFPTPLNKSEIIDTNGAGDSFVGGFLSRFIQEKPLEECIAAGHYCASECIKQSGCVFPQKPSFSYP